MKKKQTKNMLKQLMLKIEAEHQEQMKMMQSIIDSINDEDDDYSFEDMIKEGNSYEQEPLKVPQRPKRNAQLELFEQCSTPTESTTIPNNAENISRYLKEKFGSAVNKRYIDSTVEQSVRIEVETISTEDLDTCFIHSIVSNYLYRMFFYSSKVEDSTQMKFNSFDIRLNISSCKEIQNCYNISLETNIPINAEWLERKVSAYATTMSFKDKIVNTVNDFLIVNNEINKLPR